MSKYAYYNTEWCKSVLRNWYSLMMGGLNVTNDVLKSYDPLVTGFYRLFMVRKPKFVDEYYKKNLSSGVSRFDAYKHILEYGNLGVSGLSNVDLDTTDVTGGYSGKTFTIPTVAKNSMNSFTVKVFEFSGSPVREIHSTWINGIADENGGLAHFNGLIASGDVPWSQANAAAEFIYVVTDRTGMKVEYAVMLANCIPKSIPISHFDSSAGDHDKVELDLEFTCTPYHGVDVNQKAALLLKQNQIMTNSLEFFTGLDEKSGRFATKTGYNPTNGQIVDQSTLTYRTAVSNSSQDTVQSIDVNSLEKVTPSYTDMGARAGS
jgi:hypothetical protein